MWRGPGSLIELDPEVIRVLHAAGWSQNTVAARLKGAKQKRNASIEAALTPAPVETVDSRSDAELTDAEFVQRYAKATSVSS